jgi:outer membrane protein OmpA-like peptidoglycan-associated protein
MVKGVEDRGIVLFLAAMVVAGCAHKPPAPPRELAEARAAWARASSGPAAEASPARMELAREALDQAEAASGARSSEQEVRDRAYVALRRIEAAEADGAAAAAKMRRDRAIDELAAMQGSTTDRSRTQAAAERAQATTVEARVADEARATATRAPAPPSDADERARQGLAALERVGSVRTEPRGVVITLPDQALFSADGATLSAEGRTALESVAAALEATPTGAGKVTIEGHTDARSDRGYDRVLAERRGSAVRDFLVSRGARPDRFVVTGVGPARPVADNDTPEGRADNRRVEIVLPQPGASTSKAATATTTPPPALPGTSTPPTGALPAATPALGTSPSPTPPAEPGTPTPPGPR